MGFKIDVTGFHMMKDYETLDTAPSAVAVSLGAVIFDINGIIREHEWIFDIQEQIEKGRTISGDTLAWWMNQTKEARDVFSAPAIIKTKLKDFHTQMRDFVGLDKLHVWGNGSEFDTSITLDLYRNHKEDFPYPPPWKFYNHRCYRTFAAMTGCKEFVPFEGVRHNALADARHQAKCVIEAFKREVEK